MTSLTRLQPVARRLERRMRRDPVLERLHRLRRGVRQREGPPEPVTLIGTTLVLVKNPSGLIIPITLNMYQKD